MGVIVMGFGAYLQIVSPRVAIVAYDTDWYMSDNVEFNVFVENYGRVLASATLVCEARFPGVSVVYSSGLDFRLNASETKMLRVLVGIPPNLYSGDGGVATCYLTAIGG